MSFMFESDSGSESIIDSQCIVDLKNVCSWAAFDFLPHLLLGLDNHVRGLNYHVTQKLVDSQKQSMNRNHLN